MSLSIVYSRALVGVEAVEVTVEAHLSNGLPGFAIVGLPETAVRESKERVRSAILNSGLEFPARRITVNLAPADLPKAGGAYDLAIALSILQASDQLSGSDLSDVELMGELALTGELRPVRGVLAAVVAAKKLSRAIMVPADNSTELRLTDYCKGQCFKSLLEVVNYVVTDPPKDIKTVMQVDAEDTQDKSLKQSYRLVSGNCNKEVEDEIKGQSIAKFAVRVAAAGHHNLLMVGPPGCGKTLLANRLIQLLPPLSPDDAMEVASIRSVAGLETTEDNCFQRPTRTPHHTATAVSVLGGGVKAMPGEISLAHHGVLFMDELPEFQRSVLDSLREPLESGEIYVTRANYRVRFPANFQFVAAMNPCPCGYAGDPKRQCRCQAGAVERYLSKLSGPLLDRFDLIIELPGLSQTELLLQPSVCRKPIAEIEEIRQCRSRQYSRNKSLNSQIKTDELSRYCQLDTRQKVAVAKQLDGLGMSSRATHRIFKVARTIADLERSEKIADSHLNQALMLRRSKLISRLGR